MAPDRRWPFPDSEWRNSVGPKLRRPVGDGSTQGIGRRQGRPGTRLPFFCRSDGVYNNQIMPVVVDQNGENIQSGALYNWDVHAGLDAISGSVTPRSESTTWVGTVSTAAPMTGSAGPEQMLQVDTAMQLSRRWTWNTGTQGGIFSRPFGAVTAYGGYGVGTLNNISPGTEIFDNRTYYAAQEQNVTYQKSARTAFVFGGNAFTTRRKGGVLVGVDGYGAQGAILHQLNRRTSIGLMYDYMKYEYPGQYGNATAHQLLLTYAGQLSPRWNLDVKGGRVSRRSGRVDESRCRPGDSGTFRHCRRDGDLLSRQVFPFRAGPSDWRDERQLDFVRLRPEGQPGKWCLSDFRERNCRSQIQLLGSAALESRCGRRMDSSEEYREGA